MNWMHFTHNDDLDGRSCPIVTYFINEYSLHKGTKIKNIDISYEVYSSIDQSIIDFIDSKKYLDYNVVLITDMGIKPETARKIQNVVDYNPQIEFIYLDHHDTSLYLNKYLWATVLVEDHNEELISATKMLYRRFEDQIPYMYREALNEYVNDVSDYDTYLWKKKNNFTAKKYHDLFGIYGAEDFQQMIIDRIIITKKKVLLQKEDLFVLEIEEKRKQRFIKETEDKLKIIKINDYNVGIIFTDRGEYISELGNYICSKNKNIDFVAIFNMNKNTISYRTVREDLNLGEEIAKPLGGGGHTKAAGSPIADDIQSMIIKELFDELNSSLLSLIKNGLNKFINRFKNI